MGKLLPIVLLSLFISCSPAQDDVIVVEEDITEQPEEKKTRAKSEFEKTLDAVPYLQHPFLYACDDQQESVQLYGVAAKLYDYLPANCLFYGMLSRTQSHALILVSNAGDYTGPSILRLKTEDGKMDEQHKYLQDNCPGTLTSTAYLYFEESGAFCTFNSSAILEFHKVDMEKLESIQVVENRVNYSWSADTKIKKQSE